MTKLLPKTEEEITALARRIVRREIFVAYSEDEIRDSFGAILALGFESVKPIAKDIGLVYEEIDKASPGAVNGKPVFFSCKFLHRADVEPLIEKVQKFMQLLYPEKERKEDATGRD